MEKIVIPPTEAHDYMIGLKVTQAEYLKVKSYCKANKVSQTRLIRYAIKCIIQDF